MLSSGSYGELTAYERASRSLRYPEGRGLPGRVWARHGPALFSPIADDETPARSRAAADAGLAATLGIPVFDGDMLRGVVLLHCSGHESGGAAEVWQLDSAAAALGLEAGHYGKLQDFQRLSALMKFPDGVGLPGVVWHSRRPAIFPTLEDSCTFLRAAAAQSCGLTAALGLPVFVGDRLQSVVVLISRRETPLARVFEVWQPNAAGNGLQLAAAAHEQAEAVSQVSRNLLILPGQGLVGRAFTERAPIVLDRLSERDGVRADAVRRSELSVGLGIPIIENGAVRAVVVMLS